MKKFKNLFTFILVFIFLTLISSFDVYAGVKDIEKLVVEVQKDGSVQFDGFTVSPSDGSYILVKLYNGGELQYFNQVRINGNNFSFKATPTNAKFGDTLTLKITGDFDYTTDFYYSSEFKSEIEEIQASSFDLMQKFAIYYDETISTKLKFDVETSYNGNVLFVYLYGNNFKQVDSNWQNKDSETWLSFLQTITTKGYELSKKNVFIYIYDKNFKMIEAFPEKALDAIVPVPGPGSGNTPGGETGGNGSDNTGSDVNIPGGGNNSNKEEVEVINNETLNSLIDGLTYYTDKGYSYHYSFTVISATDSYIKLKGVGNFSKYDECWTKRNTPKLEGFLDAIALKLKTKYNADIDFTLYDKDGKVLTSYSYYTHVEIIDPSKTSSTTSSSSNNSQSSSNNNSGSNNSSSSTGPNYEVDEDYSSSESMPEKLPEYYELDPEYQFVPWNDKRATGLVLALYLANYGSNSASLTPIVNEETVNGYYVYEMSITKDEVVNKLNTLRNDSQKIVYVKKQTDSNNMTFTIPESAVKELVNNRAKFILDTDYYKVELDFSSYSGKGDVVINTSDFTMTSDTYAKPLFISIKCNGNEAANYFGNAIKCVIHYDSEKTRTIKDLRSINTFNSNGVMFNSTASTSEKGLIFQYTGGDTYYVRNNAYTYKGITDSYSRTAAELIASKGMVMAKNGADFDEEGYITRGDFIELIASKMGAYSSIQRYANLPSSHEHYQAVNGVYELGVLPTTYRKNLDIDKYVTVEEAIYIIERCYEVNLNNPSVTSASLLYKDKNQISVWAKVNIGKAAKIGLIPTDGELFPKENIYRYEVAELLYNLLVAEKIF